MSKRNLLFILILIFTSNLLLAQCEKEITQFNFNFKAISNVPDDLALTGNLNIDKKISFDVVQNEISEIKLSPQVKEKKSPWLGALFSVIVPGAGEFYAESYWKTAIFVAIEAGVITTAVIYNKKGNDQTDFFQNYADKNWSVKKYATWLNQFHGGNIDTSGTPQEILNEIHQAENLPQNDFLSHNLAPYGEQQYYEMIGKYDQFASGWDDFNSNQSTTQPISPHFHYYSGLRGKANDYYSVASTAVVGIYLNHFLSAIDAYWSTTIYNNEVAVNLKVRSERYADFIELVPTINLKFSF